MPRITYVEHSEVRHVIDVPIGKTVMEGARDNNVPGVPADCGGACACSTCHVYVEGAWAGRLPERGSMEADMLEFVIDPDAERSRLSCQLKVDERFEGLVVHIPREQAC